MKQNIRILLTGGGSGGHIYPLLAVTQRLKKIAIQKSLDLEFYYLGPADEFSSVLASADVKISPIFAGKIRRYFSFQNFLDIPKFFIALIQSLIKVYFIMPDVIFSKGGTGALPVVFAGWFYRIPIIIHESDTIPGLTNLLSAYFAKRIAVSFEVALKYFDPQKSAWVGTPIREELLLDIPSQESAKEELGFDSKEPLVLVIGSSQGSKRINEFIVENLVELITETQILHQTGRANFLETEKLARAALIDSPLADEVKHRYQAVPYLENNLKTALAAADIVVSRASSGAINEISAFGKPAILIPLNESAGDHQRKNAYEFAEFGGGIVIEEENLFPKIFITQINKILKNYEVLEKMKAASASFFKNEAAEIIAQEIINLAQ